MISSEAFAYPIYHPLHPARITARSNASSISSTTYRQNHYEIEPTVSISFSVEEVKIFIKALDKAAKMKNFTPREKEEFKELRDLFVEDLK